VLEENYRFLRKIIGVFRKIIGEKKTPIIFTYFYFFPKKKLSKLMKFKIRSLEKRMKLKLLNQRQKKRKNS